MQDKIVSESEAANKKIVTFFSISMFYKYVQLIIQNYDEVSYSFVSYVSVSL